MDVAETERRSRAALHLAALTDEQSDGLDAALTTLIAAPETRDIARDWIAEQLDGLNEDSPRGPSEAAAWPAVFRAADAGLPIAVTQLRQLWMRLPPRPPVQQLIRLAAHPSANASLWIELLMQVARLEQPGAQLAEFLASPDCARLFTDAETRGRIWQLLERGYPEIESLIPRRALGHSSHDEWQGFLVWVYGQNGTERVPRLAMEAILSLPSTHRLPIREYQITPERLNARTPYLKKLIARIYARIRRGPTEEPAAAPSNPVPSARRGAAAAATEDTSLSYPLSYKSSVLPFARPRVVPVVGAVYYVEKAMLAMPVHSLILCVHAMTFGGQRTYTFVHADGRIITLTEDEVALGLIFENVVDDFAGYRFRDTYALRRDAANGRFAQAFPSVGASVLSQAASGRRA